MSPRTRRRKPARSTPSPPKQTWAHLVLAVILLTGLLSFWGQLATGTAACFSALAPPTPADEATSEPPKTQPSRRSIQVKRVQQAP